jgi:hypothetical protein
MSVVLNVLFYRPVILYTAGKIGFVSMTFGMLWRILVLGILVTAVMAMVANDEGVFEQDWSRPDPGIADQARVKREAKAWPAKSDMSAEEYRKTLKSAN